jgi:hypothetical protein
MKNVAPSKIPPTISVAGAPEPIIGAGAALTCFASAPATVLIISQVARVKDFISSPLTREASTWEASGAPFNDHICINRIGCQARITLRYRV